MSKILQPGPNTATYPMSQAGFLDGPVLQAWYQGVAQEQALNQTNNARTMYLNNTFHTWLTEYQDGLLAGGDPNTPPPQPPLGFQVHVADDGITCDIVQDGPPVCSIPSYAKIPAPQNLQQAANMLLVLGGNQAAHVLTAPVSPFNSSAPIMGQPIAAPDGSRWIRVS